MAENAKLNSKLLIQIKKPVEKWHAQRFHIGTFFAVPGKRAKLQELKLALA